MVSLGFCLVPTTSAGAVSQVAKVHCLPVSGPHYRLDLLSANGGAYPLVHKVAVSLP